MESESDYHGEASIEAPIDNDKGQPENTALFSEATTAPTAKMEAAPPPETFSIHLPEDAEDSQAPSSFFTDEGGYDHHDDGKAREWVQGGMHEVPEPPSETTEGESGDSATRDSQSVLELAEETMAQAMLIFLLADLRILSATGRIRTRFEHLALDSDRSPRLTSQDYAGFYDHNDTNGVTASHIMAILLVEILREAEDVTKEKSKIRQHYYKPALLSPWGTDSKTAEAGANARKIFKRDVEAANGMPSLLHCYNEMLSKDVNPNISRVSRALYPLNEDWVDDAVPDTHSYEPMPSTNVLHTTLDECSNEDLEEQGPSLSAPTPQSVPLVVSALTEKATPPAVPRTHSDDEFDNGYDETPEPYRKQKRRSQSMQHRRPTTEATPDRFHLPQGRSQSMSHQTDVSSPAGPALPTSPGSVGTSNTIPPINSVPSFESNFKVAHFNPTVDLLEDGSDDDSIQHNLIPLPGHARMSTYPQSSRFKEIRERMEKAMPTMPESIAHRVSTISKNLPQIPNLPQLPQLPNLPKGPVARQLQEMEEIANVQTQLLNWNDHAEEYKDEGGAKSEGDETGEATLSREGGSPPKRTLKSSDEQQTRHPQFHDSETIRRLILEALDSREFWRLGFIKTFFKEGTVSHVLANSRAEMVWLSDWHTQYECTYALSIDREKKKVLLAFRGAYTESDWRHIVDWYDTATSNPVKEAYPNRPTNIRVHSGFHKYLFRVRKDTNTTKYDEIAAKLTHYCKMTGPNTRITITGHSLGAALAAIFSLYASTEERFTGTYGALECVTFGAPCIGNWRFAGAVKHQEDAGRLRVVKFRVKGDSVPHLPPTMLRTSSRGAQYWHSGIDVSLPYIRKGVLWKTLLGQPKPKVAYWDPDAESYFGSLFRQFRQYYLWNLPLRFWRFALFHTLVEHKKRMELISKSDPNSLLATCSLKELYDRRHSLCKNRRRRKRDKKANLS